MSKTVKHCGVCQENFGDRFSFCPVCGESLKTIEVGQNEAFAAASARESVIVQQEQVAAVTAPLNAESTKQFVRKEAESTNGANGHRENQPKNVVSASKNGTAPVNRPQASRANDGLYHLTILETPKSYGRYFSMGATIGLFLVMTGIVGVFIYDIFNYNLDVEPVESVYLLSPVSLETEVPFEEEKEIPRENKDEGGGGGGGGKNDPKPASKGVDAPQRPEPPLIPPSVNIPRLEKPTLAVQATTQGPVVTKREEGPYGIKSSTSLDPSDGPGRGGGQGNGEGTGQGNGVGTGIGNGIGSGRGNGRGNGIGDGVGDGQNAPEAPPARPAAPAIEKLAILGKPKPGYTDEARKNNISGTVRLRVTFSASGQVTGVSAVSGLPHGLTEKAIAAARQITFKPEKRNGVPVSISKVIEYNFTMY